MGGREDWTGGGGADAQQAALQTSSALRTHPAALHCRLELVERARSAAARQTIRKATSDLAAEGGGGGNPALNGAAGKLNPWCAAAVCTHSDGAAGATLPMQLEGNACHAP